MNLSGIPKKDRALVLQGGGSLGAYEAGVYKALYYWLAKKDKEEGKENSSTFNIIAGTSIGAMNAAVLTSYFVENNTYEGSAERLIEFWRYLSKQSLADTNPWFKFWWNGLHSMNKAFATGEAARRYYSAREFSLMGVPHVFSPLIPMLDSKFLDLYGNTWFRFSNEPLKRSLEKFAKFPIATSFEDSQPRLILVAVDVADGLPVTFDSYPKADGSRKTEYGRYISQNGNEIGFERIIKYDKGITSDHVMASGSYPVNFDYASLEVESYDPPHVDKSRQKDQAGIEISQTDNVNTYHNYYKKKKRYFWDGGLMSNTPLSQLVLMHRNYWYQIIGVKDDVINELMNRQTKYHGHQLKPRKYKEIVEGSFDIAEIVRIERKNDENTISDKTFDFSYETIEKLLQNGYEDTMDTINNRIASNVHQ